MHNSNYVVIMAGGVGSRFWPVSRTDYPKQFLDILGTGQTLIQQTFRRFAKIVPAQNIYVVTSDLYVGLVEEQLPALPKENIIGEPERKNTAPCIAYMAFKLLKMDKDASMIITPSDHLVLDEENFVQVCSDGLKFAQHNDVLLTLGIKPSYANTGYGYIRYEKETASGGVFKVKEFKEKPALETAKKYFSSGDYLWNAGIFIWNVEEILAAFKKFQPGLYSLFDKRRDQLNTNTELSAIEEIYSECEDISIDYAIMEHAQNVFVIPASFEWSDLGTWNSAWESMNKDAQENAIAGSEVMMFDATNCVVHANDDKLVVLQGLDDYIVVDTTDVLLICKKEKEQQIKDYVSHVKSIKGDHYLYTPDFFKPGYSKVI